MSFVLPDACADPILGLLSLKDIVVLYCVDRKTRRYLDVKFSGMTAHVLKGIDSVCREDALHICVVFDLEDKVKSILPTSGIHSIFNTCHQIISLGRLSMLKVVSTTGEMATFKYHSWRFSGLLKYAVSCNKFDIVRFICNLAPLHSRPQMYEIASHEALSLRNIEMLRSLVVSDMYNKSDMTILKALVMIDDNDIFDTHSEDLFYVCSGHCTVHENWDVIEDLIALSVSNNNTHITAKMMEFVNIHVSPDLGRILQRFIDNQKVKG